MKEYFDIDKAIERGDFATATKLIMKVQTAMMAVINSEELPSGLFKDMMVENYNFLDQYLFSFNEITIDN